MKVCPGDREIERCPGDIGLMQVSGLPDEIER